MLAQPKMTCRQGLSPYRGFPVESSCPELRKFNSRADAVPRLSSTGTKNEHDYEYDYEHEERARRRNTGEAA
jgi:hypothetical protein